MLCVALSVVFAGASAASVVDDVQHSTRTVHQHGLHLGSSLADDNHHHDGGDQQNEDGAPADHPTGAGHHHADGPVGALDPGVETAAAPAVAGLALRTRGADSAEGIRPGGLERPPKPNANLS